MMNTIQQNMSPYVTGFDLDTDLFIRVQAACGFKCKLVANAYMINLCKHL